MKITGIVLSKNEEENIVECLKSLKFCDEIIVVDDFSEDKTVDIAKSLGAKVFKRRLSSDFAGQRNFGLKKAKGEWVIFVDPDERATKKLASEIVQVINNSELDLAGLLFKRTDAFFGREILHSEQGRTKLLRMAKRGSGKWQRKVHETWNVQGKIYELKNPLKHYPHNTLKDFIRNINDFSTIHAKANFDEGKRSGIFKILVWPVLKFIDNFFVKAGFLDGVHGVVLALMMSFHSFLAWSKLWLIQKRVV